LLHDARVTATTEGLAVAEAVTVLLPVGFLRVVTLALVGVALVGVALVGVALVGVAVGVVVGVRSCVRSASLGGTATTGGTVAPLLVGVGWGTVIET
jgi:hypothetical protein